MEKEKDNLFIPFWCQARMDMLYSVGNSDKIQTTTFLILGGGVERHELDYWLYCVWKEMGSKADIYPSIQFYV